MKDLTISNIERQNVLNNRFAISKVQEHLDIEGNGDGGAGALSSKITPTAILVLQNGNTKLVNIKNQDAITKLLDMLPETIDKITGGSRISKSAQAAADEMAEKATSETVVEDAEVL